MDWAIVLTTISVGIASVTFIYMVMRNFKRDINSKFEASERRFEALDNRIFQIAMGKSLLQVLKEEKAQKKKAKGE